MRERVEFGIVAVAETGSRQLKIGFLSRAYPDDAGHVSLERVPSGEIRLGVAGSHVGSWYGATPWETVEATPGETVSVQLGEIPLEDMVVDPTVGTIRNP